MSVWASLAVLATVAVAWGLVVAHDEGVRGVLKVAAWIIVVMFVLGGIMQACDPNGEAISWS